MKIIAVMPFSGEAQFLHTHPEVIDGRIDQTSLHETYRRLQNLGDEAEISQRPLLVWASETVLNYLEDRGLSYYLVYPSAECKAEYLKRGLEANNGEHNVLTRLYDIAWEDLLDDLHRRRKAYPMILGKCMLMNDIMTVKDGHEIILKD